MSFFNDFFSVHSIFWLGFSFFFINFIARLFLNNSYRENTRSINQGRLSVIFIVPASTIIDESFIIDQLIEELLSKQIPVFSLSVFFLDFFLIFSLLTFFFFSLFYRYLSRNNIFFIYRYYIFCVFQLIFLFLLSFFFFFPSVDVFFFNEFIIYNFKIIFFKHCLLLLTIFILIFSLSYGLFYRNLFFLFDFPFMVTFLLFCLFLLLNAYDIFSFFLIVELISFCLYILMGFKRKNLYAVESTLKYFTLNSIVSNLILLSLALIFASIGSIQFCDIVYNLGSPSTNQSFFYFGLLLFFFILIFKVGGAPFHIWVPDVYEGSNFPTLSILVLLVKTSYFIFLLQFLDYISIDLWFYNIISHFFIFFGLLSLIVGVFGAIYQKKIKRYFAFASITHLGFIFLGLGCGVFSIGYALFYFFIYIVLNLALFCFLENFIEYRTGRRFVYLTDFIYLRESHDFTRYLFSILLFSFAGLPPTVGFISKAGIFYLLLNAQYYFLFFFCVVFALLSCFYYFRILKILLFADNSSNLVFIQKQSLISLESFSFIWSSFSLKYFFYFTCYLQLVFFFFFDEIYFFIFYNLL